VDFLDATLIFLAWAHRKLNFIVQSPFTHITACHVTTFYYVGFCYMMLRRYHDAIRAFVTVLNFIVRMRGYHTRSYQYDQVDPHALTYDTDLLTCP
jgi:hypothetical protein